jgi:hypothetical protein
MEIDLDTFLTVVYCIVSDLYQQSFARHKPPRRGKRAELSDDEVLTLMILAQWQSNRSERDFLQYVRKHWLRYFPRLLSQSQFNRRSRDLCGVLSALGPALARELSAVLGQPAYEVLDGVPVPLMRRCRGDRHRCFANEAAVGRGGSDKDGYYGVKLLTSVSPHGLITGFVIGPANTEERWMAEALLRWRCWPRAAAPRVEDLDGILTRRSPDRGPRRGPAAPLAPATAAGQATAPAYLADLGFAGQSGQRHWLLDYTAAVLTQAEYDGAEDERLFDRQLHRFRQVIEEVNQLLTALLGLAFPRARTFWGLLTPLSAKVAACNLVRWVNHLYDRPDLAHISLVSI